MASRALQRMTLAEFLDWDDGSDRRHQLVDGIPTMMAPALEAHGELAISIGAEIRSRLQPPCRVIGEAGITIPDRRDTFYVADLAITCAPREPGRRIVALPVVIVEVLSPSTGPVDRWRKVADYRTLPLGPGDRRGLRRRAPDRAAAAHRRRLAGRGPDRAGRARASPLHHANPAGGALSEPARGSARGRIGELIRSCRNLRPPVAEASLTGGMMIIRRGVLERCRERTRCRDRSRFLTFSRAVARTARGVPRH